MKQEEALVKIAESLEKFQAHFRVALHDTQYNAAENSRWYTPKQLLLNVLKISAPALPAELKVVAIAAHGAIDCLGFAETLRLIIELRRKKQNAGKQAKNPKNSVPGV